MPRIIRNFILAFLAATCLCANAFSQAVEFKLQQREGWVGTPIIMQVVAANSTGEPQAPEIAASADFVSAVVGAPQRMEMRQNINGVVSRRTTTTWTVQMTPNRPGMLTLPQVKINADGRTYLSPAKNVPISATDSGDVLAVSVRSNPTTIFAGQAAHVILEIAIRPYSNREHDVSLNDRQMWDLIDKPTSSWGLFQPRIRELLQSNQPPPGREEIRDGARWYVYDITANTNASRSGALDVGDVRIDLRYPTGITVNSDFFGSPELSISGIRKVTASPETSNLIVKALPEAGRPASFRGAVGQFSIQASAKPTKATVGDPMTLTISIQSLSVNKEELRTLQPPPLESPALTQGFRMPSDPLAGIVDGSTKIFTQTLRALNADAKEIPPIEFSYFDPSTSKYVTTTTKAIPISVSPAERISTTAMEGVSATKKDAAKTNLTEVNGGLFANAAPSVDLVSDQRLTVGWTTGMVLAAPPLMAATLFLLRRRNRYVKNNMGLARARGAAKNALRQLESANDAAAIATLIQGFIEARTLRPAGTVTRSDAANLAHMAGANAACMQTLDSILAVGERAAFAPQRGESAQALRAQATKLIDELAQLSWRHRTASILDGIQP
ncbi:MAG: hypothetical protein EXS12_02190 [Phycisphaerales bacterium]|nr:hypothetical protein [Phycisphaerales bacterium]